MTDVVGDLPVLLASLKKEIRAHVALLAHYGLQSSSKFLSSLLVGASSVNEPCELKGNVWVQYPGCAPFPNSMKIFWRPEPTQEDCDEDDRYMYAKSLFDLREYGRAAHQLNGCSRPDNIFLRLYSLFLDGERKKQQETDEREDQPEDTIKNLNISAILDTINQLKSSKGLDPFFEFLEGIVLLALNKKNEAVKSLASSFHRYPWNYAAMMELVNAQDNLKNGLKLSFGEHWMSFFYFGSIYDKFQESEKALKFYYGLSELFPKSTEIKTRLALSKYNCLEYDKSRIEFEDIIRTDPFQIDSMDAYADILYLSEDHALLNHLALRMHSVDKYTPETCNIIANSHILKGEYEKAVDACARSVSLDSRNCRAWMLMGQVYFELKQPENAIKAYRKAIDIDPLNFKSWNGIGLAYELCGMPFYSISYFQKFASIQPNDSRAWHALAEVYEKAGNMASALQCAKRAHSCNPASDVYLLQLAKLCKVYAPIEARLLYEKILQRHLESNNGPQLSGLDIKSCLVYLSKSYITEGNLSKAEPYYLRLLDYSGPEKDEIHIQIENLRARAVRPMLGREVKSKPKPRRLEWDS